MSEVQVVIVGGGPVGLFLGCRLAQLGISFRVLEQRPHPVQHSRSIGIHPPSLEKLEELGLADALIEKGIQVKRGHAFANTRYLGSLEFSSCPAPYTFVLALPQYETEALLERRLCKLAPGSLLRGVQVTDLKHANDAVQLTFRHGEGQSETISADFVVGCDGKDSTVRQLSGISFSGSAYPDTYLMGDFADSTELGADAGIYLTDAGLVESFPLPGGKRRWVAKTDAYMTEPTPELLAKLIFERLEHRLPTHTNTMLSAFGVQNYLAETFAAGRVLLAGDAAHVVNPIGGQGMNLGWLDAAAAANTLDEIFNNRAEPDEVIKNFSAQRRRAAKNAARRAAFNMAMGRATPFAFLKHAAVQGLLKTPMERIFARLFTMRGLES